MELGGKYAKVPVCADGGISEHGHIPIAFAAGAHTVMMGRMLAGTLESPGEIVTRKDGSRWKAYRGMGSTEALQANEASRARYGANTSGLMLPEGVEALIPLQGSIDEVLGLCLLALRKGMRYVKSPDLTHHRTKTHFVRVTNAGLREGHPHDVEVVGK